MQRFARGLKVFGQIWLQIWAVVMLYQIYDNWQSYLPLSEQLQLPFLFNWLLAIGGFVIGIVALFGARRIRERS